MAARGDGDGTCATPLIVVVSGPSGAGKDTLLERMAKTSRGLRFHFVVTATTRPPRPWEKDGVNHHFICRARFEEMLREGEFLEHAEVYGNLYGVPREQVRKALAEGKHVLTRVDVQGAERLRVLVPEAVFVMVLPPSEEVLRRRLVERGANSPEDVERRLREAHNEMAQADLFDHRLVNRDGALDECVQELIDIIEREARRNPPRRVSI